MDAVSYLGVSYTKADLSGEKAGELLKLYNKMAGKNGLKEVKKFADHKTAVKRTWEILSQYGRSEKKTTEKGERRVRQKRFNFVAIGPARGFKENTLRAELIGLLKSKDGVTFPQAMEVVQDFDARRKVKEKNVEIRAYEALRLIHYYVNFSLKQDEAGVIRIVPNRAS